MSNKPDFVGKGTMKDPINSVKGAKRKALHKVKAGAQKDGGYVGKNMTNESHAKFHYGK